MYLIMKIYTHHIFFIGEMRLKNVLKIIPYFACAPCK